MKQQKLIVFDLDRTLADIGAGILPADIEALKALERKGARIAICSGKPTYYLCGFMRQVGLEQPILVGENGAHAELCGASIGGGNILVTEINGLEVSVTGQHNTLVVLHHDKPGTIAAVTPKDDAPQKIEKRIELGK